MAFELEWDKTGERYYETGTDRGVLYPWDNDDYGDAVAWNGLTAVTENPSGAEPTALWADNIKYLTLMSAEEFGCTIEAYTYPDEFMQCDGSEEAMTGVYIHQQGRKKFAFSYRTKVGTDSDADAGYKIHIIYGCMASPSSRNYATVNDSPEAIQFSWEVTTTPIGEFTIGTGNSAKKFKPTACIEIDTTKLPRTSANNVVTITNLDKLEEYMYGKAAEGNTPAVKGKCPTPKQVYELLTNGAVSA